MKVKEYEEMMRYLTRKKEPTIRLPVTEYDKPIEKNKPKVRQETSPERIDRVLYEVDGIGKRPKHLDNKNIKTFEEMQSVNKVIDYSPKKTERPFIKDATKPFKKIKKFSPVNIDISGIRTDLNKYENLINTPEPEYKLPKRDKLEGIETILNIAHPFKNQ
jgi:hypothetical protein